MSKTSLSELVRAKIANLKDEESALFDQATVEAMKLADQFSSIAPEEYKLPIDAMAGFNIGKELTL